MAELQHVAEYTRRLDGPPNPEENSRFSSDHIYLVGFLVCLGHHIVGKADDRGRVSFEFERTPSLLADVSGFMSGASIPARRFSFELLKLKRTLHGGESTKVKKVKTYEGEVCDFNSASGT
jgi:hypothetical protein